MLRYSDFNRFRFSDNPRYEYSVPPYSAGRSVTDKDAFVPTGKSVRDSMLSPSGVSMQGLYDFADGKDDPNFMPMRRKDLDKVEMQEYLDSQVAYVNSKISAGLDKRQKDLQAQQEQAQNSSSSDSSLGAGDK